MIEVEAEFQEVQIILASLSSAVEHAHSNVPRVKHPHAISKKSKNESRSFARKINELEKAYTPQIIHVAAAITEISNAGWETNNNVLSLWHQLADIVTRFSEHPDTTKSVATLIIDASGTMQSFSANRVPQGIPRLRKHYVKDKRKEFILCSERNALAKLLAIKPRRYHTRGRKDKYTAWQVANMTTDIVIKANEMPNILRNSFLLTTQSPCDECAHAIAPFKPRGIFTTQKGRHFTRWAKMQTAREYLTTMGVPVMDLPGPALT